MICHSLHCVYRDRLLTFSHILEKYLGATRSPRYNGVAVYLISVWSLLFKHLYHITNKRYIIHFSFGVSYISTTDSYIFCYRNDHVKFFCLQVIESYLRGR